MARQQGQPPNTAQKEFNRRLPGAQTNGIRAARQIARSRQFIYERVEFGCIVCGAPRDRRSFPVCEACSARRKAGQR